MNAPTLEHAVETEIPVHHRDPANNVLHRHYTAYFEPTTAPHPAKVNHHYHPKLHSGYSLPLIDYLAPFLKPLRFKKKVRVPARVFQWENRPNAG